jgi:hypothetical protein
MASQMPVCHRVLDYKSAPTGFFIGMPWYNDQTLLEVEMLQRWM